MKPHNIPEISTQRGALFGLVAGLILMGLPTLLLADTNSPLGQVKRIAESTLKDGTDDASEGAFHARLTELGRGSVAATAATDVDQALVAIGKDHSQHPERYQELLQYYGTPDASSQGRQVRYSRDLNAKHLTETYRLAWESLLLSPWSDEISFMEQRSMISKAIGSIGNSNSIPILVYAFRCAAAETNGASPGSRALERQFSILKALSQLTTPQALKSMLDCLAVSDRSSPDQPRLISGIHLREWVQRFMTDRDHHPAAARWGEVLRNYPRTNLPPADRDLIESAAALHRRR